MEWRAVKGFPNYVVSDTGEIKNVNTGKNIAICYSHNGYHRVTLWRDGEQYSLRLCRIVAAAFCDGYFDGAEVNHKDENIENDCASNLEWVSHIDNMNYGTRTKRAAEKLSAPIIGVNTSNGEEVVFASLHEAGRMLSASCANICACLKGRQHSSYGYYWRYA